jgi:hypothetical protein
LEDLKGENNLQKAVMSWQDYKNSLGWFFFFLFFPVIISYAFW